MIELLELPLRYFSAYVAAIASAPAGDGLPPCVRFSPWGRVII